MGYPWRRGEAAEAAACAAGRAGRRVWPMGWPVERGMSGVESQCPGILAVQVVYGLLRARHPLDRCAHDPLDHRDLIGRGVDESRIARCEHRLAERYRHRAPNLGIRLARHEAVERLKRGGLGSRDGLEVPMNPELMRGNPDHVEQDADHKDVADDGRRDLGVRRVRGRIELVNDVEPGDESEHPGTAERE